MIRYSLLAALFAVALTACGEKPEAEMPSAVQDITEATEAMEMATEETPSAQAIEVASEEAESAVEDAIEAATAE